jgi:epoxyqueuosine reductase
VGRTAAALEWLGDAVAGLVERASENRLRDYDGQAIFDEPVVGVADGEDPLFERFREVVSPDHIMPRELLEEAHGRPVERVRVVVWALPFAEAVRASNRAGRWPSRLYSVARNNGGALNHLLRERVVQLLRDEGFAAVAPVLSGAYSAFRSPEHTFTSTWSERHAAFAAGLGRFGLNNALITPRGSSARIGSVVTDLDAEPTPRPHEDYRAPCRASGGRLCGRCMERCPVGAVSGTGMDKTLCYEMREAVRGRFMDAYAAEMHMLKAPVVKSGSRDAGYSLGCALCINGVPCEACDPFAGGEGGGDA